MHGLEEQFQDRVDFILLDVDVPGTREAANAYSITGRTQYVLIDAGGNVIHKWFGPLNREAVAAQISAYLDSLG